MHHKLRLLRNFKQGFAPLHTYLMHAMINCHFTLKRKNQPAHSLISFDNMCIWRRPNSLPSGIVNHHFQFHCIFCTWTLFNRCFSCHFSFLTYLFFFFLVFLSVVFSNSWLALSPICHLLCLHFLPSPAFSLQLLLLRWDYFISYPSYSQQSFFLSFGVSIQSTIIFFTVVLMIFNFSFRHTIYSTIFSMLFLLSHLFALCFFYTVCPFFLAVCCSVCLQLIFSLAISHQSLLLR